MCSLQEQQSTEEGIVRKLKNKMSKAKNRTAVQYKEGLRSHEILKGYHIVLDIEDSENNIGKMDVACKSCGALKFRKETSTTCCNNGKVVLEFFPQPPEELNKL